MAKSVEKNILQYPVTPESKSSMLELSTDPSHRIVGDMFSIAFEADPAIVRSFVPRPMELDGSGLCYLRCFNACIFTDRHLTELMSPERYEFTESFLWIPCSFKGELYHYMPFSWVNRDWLAYLGRTVGQPHKVAKVQMTRFHPADTVYYGPHQGVHLTFSVDGVGRVLQGALTLQREYPLDDPELPLSLGLPAARYLARRYFWDVLNDRPLVDDLVAHWGDRREIGPIWGGPAELEFLDAENEEVSLFVPRRVIGGWWHTLRYRRHRDERSPASFKGNAPIVLHSFV